MTLDPAQIYVLLEALGIGMLIGIERERNAQKQGAAATAGVRTFALAALLGALCQIAGGWPLLAVALGLVGGLWALSQFTAPKPQSGLTTSFALLIVVILGGLAADNTMLAAAAAVVVAALLFARSVLHDFSRSVLTAVELRDGLILGVATLVILPVLPTQGIGPGEAINPQRLFIMVLLVMAIGAGSHISTRVLGARLGLPLGGLLAGFVSSTAVVSALATKAKEIPAQALAAAAGATLSSISSLLQTGVILLFLSPLLFAATAPILALPIIVAATYGGALTYIGLRQGGEKAGVELPAQIFSIRSAVTFAVVVTAVLVISAFVNDMFGARGVIITVAIAGAVSTSSAAVALASLVGAGQMTSPEAVLPMAVAIMVNTVLRIFLAFRMGTASYPWLVGAGLLMTGLAVAGALWYVEVGLPKFLVLP